MQTKKISDLKVGFFKSNLNVLLLILGWNEHVIMRFIHRNMLRQEREYENKSHIQQHDNRYKKTKTVLLINNTGLDQIGEGSAPSGSSDF